MNGKVEQLKRMVEDGSLVIVNLDEDFNTEWRVYIDDVYCNNEGQIQHFIVGVLNITNMHFANEEELLSIFANTILQSIYSHNKEFLLR